MPLTEGYISSNFGIRKPNSFETVYASVKPITSTPVAVAATPKPEVKAELVERTVEVTDSYGNKREIKVMVTPKQQVQLLLLQQTPRLKM
ncbi:hypothetical protein [Chryseobacterium indoltheticum]|uniref:hypothetical protein n=1 Tax=Chryseobacterium indoltheticum TaxID=254 RepID=UPI003F490C18